MSEFIPKHKIESLAQHYKISQNAIIVLLKALERGNGSMAQFDHPELGGAGQWMQGGMTMIGDMSNQALETKVNNLCSELSNLLAQKASAPAENEPHSPSKQTSWWPAEFGEPDASGGQNNMKYAYFSRPHRLIVKINDHLTIYDTLNHHISGVSQQQQSNNPSSLSFSSQQGELSLSSLPIITLFV
jgi:hypothetical protein